MMPNFNGDSQFNLTGKWNMYDLFGKTGSSALQWFTDIDSDGDRELVVSVGGQSHFAAIDQNHNILWENIQNTTPHKPAYVPKIHDGALFYGDRSNDTVYAVNLSDGTLRWSASPVTGLEAIEFCDNGLVVGGDSVALLGFLGGLTKWTVNFNQHEQRICAGDLDGDGTDEIVLNDNRGNIEVRNDDGTLKFSLSSSHNHVDRHVIGDIDPSHIGNELLTVIDDDNSSDGEGDEIVTYDASGTLLNKYNAPASNVSYAVEDIHPNQDGLEIAFGLEGGGTIGMLDGTLSVMWTRPLGRTTGNAGGQTWVADADGDGELEFAVNMGESSGDGFRMFTKDGEYIAQIFGHGWNASDNSMLRSGSPGNKRYIDIDGDGRDEMIPKSLSPNDHDIITPISIN